MLRPFAVRPRSLSILIGAEVDLNGPMVTRSVRLTNAAKHSGASVITVSAEVEQVDGALRLEVADDGVGGADFSGGTGLLGLKDRVDALGGRIDLHSPPGGGTTLRVVLPLPSGER